MNILDFVILALAANAVITAWFYGSIFEKYLKAMEERKDLLGELMSCILCLPYHVAFWTILILWLPGFFLQEPWHTVSRVPLYAFALTTLIHYMQSVLPVGTANDRNGDQNGLGKYTASGSSSENHRVNQEEIS